MKTLFRFLVLGTFLTMLGTLSIFAQDADEFAKLFERYKLERKQPCGKRDAALATGKTILEKYGEDKDNPDVIKFVREDVAKIEAADPDCKLIAEYNAAFPAKDWNKFLTLSKQLLAKQGSSPLGLDVTLTAASVGYDRAVEKNDTYNADTINYAKQAIQRLEAGGTSETGNFGTFAPFKTKAFTDGKTNSLNWMNYIIGWIYYNRLGANDPNKKKEGLVYLYKSTLYNGENKNDHTIYTNIGSWYFDQAAVLDEKIRAIRDSKPDPATEEGKAKIEEQKAHLAMAKGYADRAIDAFGRARQIAVAGKKTTIADAITKRLGELYRFRFNLAPDAKTPELETYVSGFLTKPMPDPSNAVTPVIEEEKPTTTTTSTTPATTTTPTTKTTTTTTKQPMSAVTTKDASTTATKTSTTTKKPVVTKKKGTR